MEKINEDISDLRETNQDIKSTLTEISSSLKELCSRVDSCERSNSTIQEQFRDFSSHRRERQSPSFHSSVGNNYPGPQQTYSGHLFTSPPEGGIASSRPGIVPLSEDIQGDFRELKDSYQKVQLGTELKLNAEKTGIRREDHPRFNVIVNAAKYSETILKVLAERSSGDGISVEHCDEIARIAIAQQKYLQEEYASLLVNNTFNPQTAKLFKQLQRNSSLFPTTALSNLQAAATISAAATSTSSDRGRGRGSTFRGRGYGYRGRRGSDSQFTAFGGNHSIPVTPRVDHDP